MRAGATGIADKLTAIEEALVQTRSRSFEDPLNYPGKLTAQLASLHAVTSAGAECARCGAGLAGDRDHTVTGGSRSARLGR